MSVYQRKDSRYWWCKFDRDGHTIRCSTRQTKKREAEKFERELKRQYDQTGQTTTQQHTFGEALARWLDADAPSSMLSHARNVRVLENHFLEDTPRQANLLRDRMLKAGYSPYTINRRLAVVKRVLNLAYRQWDMIDRPLAEKIGKVSERGLERDVVLDYDEFQKLLAAIPDPAVLPVVALAVHTGMRRGELLKLTPDDWKPPYLICRKTKNGKTRSVPVVAELHHLVDLPFLITEHQLRTNFETAREQIGRPDVRFHDLRHTFATWVADDPSVPILLLSKLLGHSSLAVTSKYAHVRGDNVERIEDAMARVKR